MNEFEEIDKENIDNGGAIALKGFNYQNAVASLIAILNYDRDNFLLFVETKDDIEVDVEDKHFFIQVKGQHLSLSSLLNIKKNDKGIKNCIFSKNIKKNHPKASYHIVLLGLKKDQNSLIEATEATIFSEEYLYSSEQKTKIIQKLKDIGFAEEELNHIPYKNVANDLAQYASSVIPSALFEYLFGISTNIIMDKKQERLHLLNEKKLFGQQYDTLSLLKDDFIRNDAEEYVFDEQEAINDIKKYLLLAENINIKLNDFKSNIYQKKIEIDNLKVEVLELTKIIENTRRTYNEIKGECSHCGSDLTEKQSIKRIRLENDNYEATLLRNDLNKKIKKLEDELDNILQNKLGLENEYTSLLSIAQKKQGEITLQQFIEQKARKLAKGKYVDVKNTLNEKIAELTEKINKLTYEIKDLEKQQKIQKDTIGLRFNELKENLKITFSAASLM